MMKPKFDDVIEYVKAGEDNPDMEEMLRLNPDGQELLKQARFICKMLQRQSELADDGDIAASLGRMADEAHQVADMPAMDFMNEPPRSRTFYQEAPLRLQSKRSPSIDDMIEGEGRNSEELGTLEFTTEGEQVNLSYEPSDAVMKYLAAQRDIEGIQIRGRRITLSLPDTLPADQPVEIRVAQSLKNTPVRRLNLIFMPDSGPFVRLETDSEGFAQLPIPDQPGTLRVETPTPIVLRIKLNK